MNDLDVSFRIDKKMRDLENNLDFLNFKRKDLEIISALLQILLDFTEEKKVKK